MTRPPLRGSWSRFWFEPQPTSTVAVARVAIGATAFLWGLSLLPDVDAFYSTHGIEPVAVIQGWAPLQHYTSNAAVHGAYVALLVSALAVVVGFRTRIASVTLFVLVHAFITRAPSVGNSGDQLLRILTFFLVFMPAGDALSLDRSLRCRDTGEPFWKFPERAPWALRLVQLQVSLLYLTTVFHKFDSGAWLDGTALSYAWRMDDLARFQVPSTIANSVPLSTTLSFLAVAIELLVGIFVWSRSARPLVLGLGLALHLAIALTLRIGFFSLAIMVSYLSFLAPDTAGRIILGVRNRWRARREQRAAATDPPISPTRVGEID